MLQVFKCNSLFKAVHVSVITMKLEPNINVVSNLLSDQSDEQGFARIQPLWIVTQI